MSQFEHHTTPDGHAVVTATGEVDLAVADQLRTLALEVLGEATSLSLDMTDVTFMDSTGLGVVVMIHREAGGSGKEFWLVGVPPVVQRLLTITGMTDVIEVREA